MNNIYVDELPKSCDECPCCNSDVDYGACCNLGSYGFEECYCTNQKHPNCPLKLITDRLAEERKRVLWEIRKRAKRTQFYIEPTEKSPTGKQKGFIYEFSDRLLDQIERGE